MSDNKRKSLLLQMITSFNKWEYSKLYIGWVWAFNSIVLLVGLAAGEGTLWTAFAAGFCFLVAVVYWNRFDQRIKK